MLQFRHFHLLSPTIFPKSPDSARHASHWLVVATGVFLAAAIATPAAHAHFHIKHRRKNEAASTQSAASGAASKNATNRAARSGGNKSNVQLGQPQTGPFQGRALKHHPLFGDEPIPTHNAPLVVPPSTLDITTAKFGKLEIELKDAAFLEASVKEIHLIADRLDMANGILYSLGVKVDDGEFQDFTIDLLEMSSQGNLHFDVPTLLNDKILQFPTPAVAQAHVIISQTSLNEFINSTEVLERLSGSAKKRVPILSTLAKQDVNFGFTFTGGALTLEPDNHVHLSMNSKLGVGNSGMPVQLAAETKLMLENGWVDLTDTHLVTGGATVPHDMSAKIVRRINDLSKWGSASDDIQFQFTDLKVVPNDHLELEGTAVIKRLRFERSQPSTTPSGDATGTGANGTGANGTGANCTESTRTGDNGKQPTAAGTNPATPATTVPTTPAVPAETPTDPSN